MDIQFLPRSESTVLDKRRPVEAALRKLKSGEMIVVCPATQSTQHSFTTAARRLGIRIETGLDGDRMEIALIEDRRSDQPPKPKHGDIIATVRAFIESSNEGARLVDIANGCGITPQQANSATKKLAERSTIHHTGKLWRAGERPE